MGASYSFPSGIRPKFWCISSLKINAFWCVAVWLIDYRIVTTKTAVLRTVSVTSGGTPYRAVPAQIKLWLP